MAQMLLVMGESGTGKSTSLRNCDPVTTAVVNPVGKPLPFKNRFEMLNNVTDARTITKYMKEQAATGKKLIVVDDFQYILAVPYMNRIKETGWDKYNDFGANYFDIINVCKDLPDDVVVAYMTHLETLENGLTTVKLIGKLLREKITIEGLFTVVLRTGVNEGKYYFYTQNSGKDTVKSPLGMFPAYAIDNDLNYVADKIRNFYEIGEYKSDAEMNQADAAVAGDVEKPDANGRRARSGRSSKATEQTAETTEQGTTSTGRRARGTKTHDEVVAENQQKMAEYQEKCDAAIAEVAGDAEEVDFDTACAATENIPKPEFETPPRRTRKERQAASASATSAPETLTETTYFFIEATGNYVMKQAGDVAPEGGKVITKDEFVKGGAAIARSGQGTTENAVEGAMNPPETGAAEEQGGRTRRQRRTR